MKNLNAFKALEKSKLAKIKGGERIWIRGLGWVEVGKDGFLIPDGTED